MTSQTGTATARSQATCSDLPEESMRVIAEGLTRRGLTVRITGCEDSQLLKVTGAGRRACEVLVAEDYYFTCEYPASRARRTGPAEVARIVARMLGSGYPSPQQYAHLHHGATPAGAVGRDMKARGMTVTLSVAEDQESYTVYAGVVVTNPAKPERGKVLIEDGWIYWECYGDEISGGPAELTNTLADVLTPSTPLTTRDRLAAVYGACLHTMTPGHTRTADAATGNRSHHR